MVALIHGLELFEYLPCRSDRLALHLLLLEVREGRVALIFLGLYFGAGHCLSRAFLRGWFLRGVSLNVKQVDGLSTCHFEFEDFRKGDLLLARVGLTHWLSGLALSDLERHIEWVAWVCRVRLLLFFCRVALSLSCLICFLCLRLGSSGAFDSLIGNQIYSFITGDLMF